MFIGEKEIDSIEHKDEDVILTFKEGEPVTMNEALFDLLVSEEKKEGSITDVVRMKLSAKYLQDMADLGLENYMVEQIAMGMQTLAHNLREQAIAKAFGCTGALDIKLSKLI